MVGSLDVVQHRKRMSEKDYVRACISPMCVRRGSAPHISGVEGLRERVHKSDGRQSSCRAANQ